MSELNDAVKAQVRVFVDEKIKSSPGISLLTLMSMIAFDKNVYAFEYVFEQVEQKKITCLVKPAETIMDFNQHYFFSGVGYNLMD